MLWQADPESLKQILIDRQEFEGLRELFEENPALKSESYWGLIGSHLPGDEDPDEYAKRLLRSITGIKDVYLKQVKVFGSPKRVPHYRVLTIAYYALINPGSESIKKSPVAKAVRWFDIDDLPEVIFDVKEIIDTALERLQQEVKYHPVGFHLLPEKFTLTQLQTLYEVILTTKLDTRNFRKKIMKMGLLIDTEEKQKNVAHRAAKLYSFDKKTYQKLVREGLNFSM